MICSQCRFRPFTCRNDHPLCIRMGHITRREYPGALIEQSGPMTISLRALHVTRYTLSG